MQRTTIRVAAQPKYEPLYAMNESEDKVRCECHGEAYTTFVCEHLVGASGLEWYSSEPTDEDRWPSAWCSKCHEAFSLEGEWNDRSERAAALKAKLICHYCYEDFRSQCIHRFI